MRMITRIGDTKNFLHKPRVLLKKWPKSRNPKTDDQNITASSLSNPVSTATPAIFYAAADVYRNRSVIAVQDVARVTTRTLQADFCTTASGSGHM